MKVTQNFIDNTVVRDNDALTADIISHLGEVAPHIVKAYPAGYLISLVRHSALLARDYFSLNELAAIRTFVRLRWDIAPGFYNEPTIAAALLNTSLRPMERFDTLMTPEAEHVWLDAMVFDGPAYWRGQYSDGFGDVIYPEGAA